MQPATGVIFLQPAPTPDDPTAVREIVGIVIAEEDDQGRNLIQLFPPGSVPTQVVASEGKNGGEFFAA